MMKILYTVFFISIGLSQAFAQSVGDFRSLQTGDWTNSNTWEELVSIGPEVWSNTANTPTSADGVISILNTHTVTVTTSLSTDQTYIRTGGQVTINNSVTLTAAAGSGDDLTVESGAVLLNNGTLVALSQPVPPPPKVAVIRVYGTINNTGSFTGASVSTLKFEANSTYIHNRNSGSIPTATWNATSTTNVTGVVDGLPTGLSQSFGNFYWNCPSQNTFFDFSGGITTVNGDLQILDNGYAGIYLATVNDYTLTVGGDMLISGSTYFGFNSANTATINTIGNLTISNGALIDHSFDGDVTLNIGGNLEISNSTVNIAYGGASIVTYNLSGDVVFNSNTVDNLSASNCSINFNGNGSQVITGGFDLGNFNFTVVSNSDLTLISNTDYIGSTLNYSMNTGASLTLGTTAAGGAIQTGTTNGAIRVAGTRTFNAGSTIEFNGAATQFLGNGFPASDVNLIINNSGGGVDMLSDLTISSGRSLTLTQGTLNIGNGNTLTLNGTVSTTAGGISGGSLSNLSIGGSGAFGTLGFVGTNSLNDFTINRTSTGSVTLGNDLTVLGTFTQTFGNLNLNGNTLTLSGPYSRTAGSLIPDATSSIVINGAGALPATFPLTGTMQSITMDRAATTFNTGAFDVVVSNLNALSGTLDYSLGSFDIADGGTVERQASATFNTALTSPGSFDLTYNNDTDISSGGELPTNTTALNSLTKTGGAVLTLNSGVTINGNLTLSNGNFNAGANTVSLNGNFIDNAASTLTSATIIFDGITTLSGSNNPTFGNITINGSFSPTIALTVNGDITNNGTFSNSAGTLTINAASQLAGTNPIAVNNFTIGASGVVTASATAALEIDGAFANNGSFDANGGTVIFGGTTSISGTVPNFHSVQIEDVLNAPSTLVVAGNFTNNGTFTHNNGLLDMTGTGTRTLGGTSALPLYTLNVSGGTVNVNNAAVSITDGITVGASTTLDLDGGGSGITTLLSTASKDAYIAEIPGTSTVSGNLTVQRSIYAQTNDRGYHIMGFPVTGVTVIDIQGEIAVTGTFTGSSTGTGFDSNPSIYAFNESAGATLTFNERYAAFPAADNGESFTNGQGYYVYTYPADMPSTIVGTGAVKTGPFSTNLSRTGVTDGAGWHMIANPYPAGSDWSLWSNGNVEGSTAYLYNPSTMGYDALDGIATGIIPQGQGVFVRAISDGVSIDATESTKVTTTTSFLRNEGLLPRFEIILRTPDYDDKSIVLLNDNATDGFEPKYDARRLLNTYETISTVSTDGESLKVNRLGTSASNCNKSFYINLEQMKNATDYQIVFEDLDHLPQYTFSVIDHYLGTTTSISSGDLVSFNVNSDAASQGTNRFEVVMVANVPKMVIVADIDVCSEANAIVSIPSTATTNTYFIFKDNTIVAEILGTGGNVEAAIASSYLSSSFNNFIVKASNGICDTVQVASFNVTMQAAINADAAVSGSNVCAIETSAPYSVQSQTGVNYYVLFGTDTLDIFTGDGSVISRSIEAINLSAGNNELTVLADRPDCSNTVLTNVIEINYDNFQIDTTVGVKGSSICANVATASYSVKTQSGVEYYLILGQDTLDTFTGNGSTLARTVDATKLSGGTNAIDVLVARTGCGNATLENPIIIEKDDFEIDQSISYFGNAVCIGEDGQITIATQDLVQYELIKEGVVLKSFVGNGAEQQISLPAELLLTGENNYNLKATYADCQEFTFPAAASVIVNDQLQISAIANQQLCIGESAQIQVQSNFELANYNLFLGAVLVSQFSSNNLSFIPTASGDYKLVGTTNSGCTSNEVFFNVQLLSLEQPTVFASANILRSSIEAESYQWYKDGILLEGETNQLLVVQESGSYAVELLNGLCSITSDVYSFDASILNASEKLASLIAFYPNPVRDKLRIEYSDNGLNQLKVTIFTTSGVLLSSYEEVKNGEMIDLSRLDAGLYIIQFSANDMEFSARVIKD